MAFSLVQSNNGNSGAVAVSSLAVAFLSNVTVGNLLIGAISSGGSTFGVITSLTDTQGNVWTLVANTIDGQASTDSNIYFAVAGATGACTVTAHLSGTHFPMMIVGEYNLQNGVLDQTSGIQILDSAGSNPVAITTTKATELIIVCTCDGSQYTTGWSINQSFVIDSQQTEAGANECQALCSVNAALSGTTTQPTTNHDGFVFSPTCCQASFYVASTVPTPGAMRGAPTGRVGKSGIKQTLIAIPEMNSFEEVRQAMAKAINDLQLHIASQLPVTNHQGQRLSNVGPPVSADDVVTLKYLQSIYTPPKIGN